MSIIPALNEGIRDTEEFGRRTYALLEEIRKEYGEPVFFYLLGKEAKKYGDIISLPVDKTPREGYIMPGFEQLKKDPALQEKFVNAFIQAHELPTPYRSRLKEYLQLAIDSAEELAEYIGKEGKHRIDPKKFYEFKKFDKFIETIMEREFGARPREVPTRRVEKQRKRKIVRPEEVLEKPLAEFEEEDTISAPKFPQVQKKRRIVRPEEILAKPLAEPEEKSTTPTPKYPATKKEVEEELRKAGIPEEKVKVVAPRLATAVWLDKWFENAVKSYTYKKLGGVPLDEIKNLRNMILAKKHVAEVAAKVMEEHWARNNHVKIGERHVDRKMLPLVREHASGMFEDLENIRKAVKEGKMSVEEALLRLHAELFVISKALESIGELTGTPEYLAPNPRPLGVSDRYVVTLDKVRKTHEKLRGTLRIYLQ
ncbi:hypothetical protein [Thermococcus thioreducens]|uniref:Uncharacterized protein n=1 Tax=Thermococcus thioreducens TaxID=277988 RepID=A0A0Q2MQM0_9EURY|nr:hypothetical protein [Thermococcus thioreducens]ASJ11734.1 hypothetical protein A3L14_02000 [Thermococcus thioreducens]KQH81975.1 hypothetical protein AMR53_08535 [Thermococcus thioreducens]SEW14795.1 hypothetical protein SAMN05216170_1882 [Thermococcus thioreducens]